MPICKEKPHFNCAATEKLADFSHCRCEHLGDKEPRHNDAPKEQKKDFIDGVIDVVRRYFEDHKDRNDKNDRNDAPMVMADDNQAVSA